MNDIKPTTIVDNVPMGKDLEIGAPKNGPNRKVNVATTAEKKKASQIDLNLKNDGQNFEDEDQEMRNDEPKGEWIKQDMNLPVEAVRNDEYRRGNIVSDAPPIHSEISNKDKLKQQVDDLPSLELSLKRLGDISDTNTDLLEQNILKHSQLSAFTRYATEFST